MTNRDNSHVKPLVLQHHREGRHITAAALLLVVNPDLFYETERWTEVRDCLHALNIADRNETITDNLAAAIDEYEETHGPF